MHPTPPKRAHTITQHGITRNDEYYWMREKDDPEVLKYLNAENKYLEKELQHLRSLKEHLYKEMKGRIRESDSSVPEKIKGYLYYTRTEAEKQYPIYCRKKEDDDATEEVLLDQNLLAQDHEFCSIGPISISPDQNKLIYSLDFEGAEIYTIYIKDLTENKLFPESIPATSGSAYHHAGVEWANDSQTFFYITIDEYHRADKLWKHTIGTDPKDDVLIFHEKDDAFSLSISKTRSRTYITTYHYNTTSQEVRFIPADQPDSELRVLQPRKPNLDYFAVHHGDWFLILTNHHAENYKLVKAPVSDPCIEN